MTDASTQNPFAPPRATVADTFADAPPRMVVATRGQRFLAVLVDISPDFVIGLIGVVMAFIMMPGLMARNSIRPPRTSPRSACSSW